MNESLLNLQKQVVELDTFMQTAVYRSYQKTFKADIATEELTIINTIPATPESVNFLIERHAVRQTLQSGLTFFETARSRLEELIAQLEDAESQATDNKEQNKQ